MAAVPSLGRAGGVEKVAPAEADLTRTLYERYAAQIYRYCLHQLGSREEAEDAVQSTFLNAFRGIKRGVVPELESAWLFKIAHNVCLSRRRSSWRRGRIESPTEFDLVAEVTPAPSRRADELIGLQDVLEGMPENQRRAILLREWQGLSYREIAAELELSQAAVETLIFRARRSLAAGLEEAPVERPRRRVARAADLGNLVAGLKTFLLGGGAAAKVAAAVVVVGATTVVAAAPVARHQAKKAPPVPVAPPAVVHAAAPSAVQRAPVVAASAAARSTAKPKTRQATPAAARARGRAAAARGGANGLHATGLHRALGHARRQAPSAKAAGAVPAQPASPGAAKRTVAPGKAAAHGASAKAHAKSSTKKKAAPQKAAATHGNAGGRAAP